jgi:hypothetical protein
MSGVVHSSDKKIKWVVQKSKIPYEIFLVLFGIPVDIIVLGVGVVVVVVVVEVVCCCACGATT